MIHRPHKSLMAYVRKASEHRANIEEFVQQNTAPVEVVTESSRESIVIDSLMDDLDDVENQERPEMPERELDFEVGP